MKKKPNSQSAFFNPRSLLTLAFCAGAVLLAVIALYPVATARAQASKPTNEEAQKLAEGLKPLINYSSEGLKPQARADGSVYVNLEGRFQNVIVAKQEEDGTLSQSCVNNPESAAAFFNLNPQDLGAAKAVPVSGAATKPLPDR
jgi:hypothetical protein